MNGVHALNRRQLFAVTGGAVTAALVGCGPTGQQDASPARPGPATAQAAGRKLRAASYRFDLSAPSNNPLRNVRLSGGQVMQSFAFDHRNKRLFTAQALNNATGDLQITCLDFAGNIKESMKIAHCGHGVSFGVDPAGAASVLWVEAKPKGQGESARGTTLCAFPFAGGEYPSTENTGTLYKPIAGTDTVTCAINPIDRRLAMRYHRPSDKTWHYAIYDLDDLDKPQYGGDLAKVPHRSVKEPAGLAGPTVTPQGYTIYDNFIYVINGNAYDDPGKADDNGISPPPCRSGGDNPASCRTKAPYGNTKISCIDISTGDFADKQVHTNAGYSLTYREPEGIAVYHADDANEDRLFFGFASGESGKRRANFFYKNKLILN